MARLAPVLIVLALAGCGSSSKSVTPPTTAPGSAATPPQARATTQSSPSGLQAEAAATATGDIPDNQHFLTFSNRAAGYSLKYPEGWARTQSGASVTFRDKNNVVRVLVSRGSLPAPSAARRGLAKIEQGPERLSIRGAPALKVVYSTESAPNPVTGKRVTLVVDRYYLAHAGRVAVVDLGTPRGVDNVDAYRMMIQSFRWR